MQLTGCIYGNQADLRGTKNMLKPYHEHPLLRDYSPTHAWPPTAPWWCGTCKATAHAGKGDFVCSKIVGHSNTGGVDRSTLTISGIGTSIGEDFERKRTSFRLENVATAIAF